MTNLWQKRIASAAIMVAAYFACIVVSGQNRVINGVVVDATGAYVAGASAIVSGNPSIGTVTGIDGRFSISVPPGSSLEVSCLGYAGQTIQVGDRTELRIVLIEDTEYLEETVVIGYGVQKKSDLTGSVASVKAEDMWDRSTSDAASALQGKASGVQVFNSSGAPGSASTIRVRGLSSNGEYGLGPLLIVDGLKVDNIQYLDPSLIESMEILKDAASAAIYGAQAGNGVVLITTKNGSRDKDGTIFYNYKFTTETLRRHAQVMNGEQYLDWNIQAGNFTREKIIADGWWDGKTDTNWADVLFAPSFSHSHTLGAQGGNGRGSYFVSLNYIDQDGIVRGDKDYYKRLTAQVNADYKIKSWFTVGTNTSIERFKSQLLGEHSEYQGSTILGALVLDPLTPVYYTSLDQLPYGMRQAIEGKVQKVYQNEQGYYYATSKFQEGDGGNPLVFRDRAEGKNEGWNVRGSLFANLSLFKGLVFTSRLGYRVSQGYSNNYEEPFYLNTKINSSKYTISERSSQFYYYQWENFANYSETFGEKHTIGVMAGMSYTCSDSRSVGATLEGTDPLKGYAENFRYIDMDNGSGTKSFSGTSAPMRNTGISYFGRLSYTFDNRYSVQTNFRADAFDSSKLSRKNRWGFFPSVSAGWTVSNEGFIKDNISRDALGFLKFRASWGVNGNIAALNDYAYSTTVSYNSKVYQWGVTDPTISHGSIPDGLANPDLKWETSEQLDFGIDARFLRDRLTFGADWYNKQTKDLLMTVNPVLEVGAGSSIVNAGSIRNRGVEFELGWRDIAGDFHYSVNANFSTLSNLVTYMTKQGMDRIPGEGFSNFKSSTAFEEGYPVWYIRGFEYAGVSADGKAQFLDADGKITQTPSTTDLKCLGNSIPTYNYGITLRAEWKGIDFTFFGTGAGGNKIIPCIYRTEHPLINSLEYFHENAGKTLPSYKEMASSTDFWSSSANLFDGDYFKIKQLQLGYSLPANITRKILLGEARLYVSLDDFFTFTKYPGFDPETASDGDYRGMGLDKGSYPNSGKVLVGVNISF